MRTPNQRRQNLLYPPDKYTQLYNYIRSLNPVAYYPLNEERGALALNHAPATLGTLNGTITGATIGQAGKVGKAYSFDGLNDVVTLPNGASSKNQSLVSLGAIVKVTDNAAIKTIIWEARTSSAVVRLGLDLTADEKLRLAIRVSDSIASAQVLTSNSALPAGYHFIGITLDVPNKAGLLYVDGASVAFTGNLNGFDASAFNNSDPFQLISIGRSATVEWFNDQIQHLFKVHGRLITAAEWLRLARIAGLA